jgi:hypothetical protein
MPLWTVKVNALIPEQQLTFEREVEAETKEEAEAKAELDIEDGDLKDVMDLDFVTYESEAIHANTKVAE